MRKLWFNNDKVDRLAMLQQTEAKHSGINQMAIEKDWWVTITLKALFQTSCADSLLFKGGTSLSKGFNIIERFSEDIDLSINHSFFGIDKTTKNQRETEMFNCILTYTRNVIYRLKLQNACLSVPTPYNLLHVIQVLL